MGVFADVNPHMHSSNFIKSTVSDKLQLNMNTKNGTNDEREEGEIIDEFEDIISSDEEYSMLQRIEELEAKNAELEKIENISSIYDSGNYDYSKKDSVHQSDRYPLISIDISDDEDYPPAPPMSRIVKRRKSFQRSGIRKTHRRRKHSSSSAPSPPLYRPSDKILLSMFRKRSSHSTSTSSKRRKKGKKSHSTKSSRRARGYYLADSGGDDNFDSYNVNLASGYENYNSADGQRHFALNREVLRVALARNTHRNEQHVTLKDRLIRRKENTNTLNEKSTEELHEVVQVEEEAEEVEEENQTKPDSPQEKSEEKEETEEDEDNLEEQELRIIALKSAVLRKHLVRKKRDENAAYSPSDFDEIYANSAVSPSINNIDEPETCNSMEISPAPSPKLLVSDDEGIDTKPVDMDIANSDSDCELPGYDKWVPIDQIPLPDNMGISEGIYIPTPIRYDFESERTFMPPAPTFNSAPFSPVNLDSELEEEEVALRALLLAKMNSPKVNKAPKEEHVKMKKVATPDPDLSLDADALRSFLIDNMKKKTQPKHSPEDVLKEAVRRLTGRNAANSPAECKSDFRLEFKSAQQTEFELGEAISGMSRVKIEMDWEPSAPVKEDIQTNIDSERGNLILSEDNSHYEEAPIHNEISIEVKKGKLFTKTQNKKPEISEEILAELKPKSLICEEVNGKIPSESATEANKISDKEEPTNKISTLEDKTESTVKARSLKMQAKARNKSVKEILSKSALEDHAAIPPEQRVEERNKTADEALPDPVSKAKNFDSSKEIVVHLQEENKDDTCLAEVRQKKLTLANENQSFCKTPLIDHIVSGTVVVRREKNETEQELSKSKKVSKAVEGKNVEKTASPQNWTTVSSLSKSTQKTVETKKKATFTLPTTIKVIQHSNINKKKAQSQVLPKRTVPSTQESQKQTVKLSLDHPVKSSLQPSAKIPITPMTKIVKPNKVINNTTAELKRKAAEVVAQNAVPAKKPKSDDRLITAAEVPQVKQLIIRLRVSESESEYSAFSADDCDDDETRQSFIDRSITIGNEYYDIASPISLPMESPCDTPTRVASPLISVTPTTKPSVAKSIVNDFFEAKLDQFLKNARSKIADTPPQPVEAEVPKVVPLNTPVAVRHLPEASQQEYRRLINRMKLLERQKNAKNLQVEEKTKKIPHGESRTVMLESDGGKTLVRKVLVKNTTQCDKNTVAPQVTKTSEVPAIKTAVAPIGITVSATNTQISTPSSPKASKERLSLYEISYRQTGKTIISKLDKNIALVLLAKNAKIAKLKHEQRLKELKKEMEELQGKIEKEQEQITKHCPEILSSNRMIESLKSRRQKMNKTMSEMGQKITGESYSIVDHQKPIISAKTKILAAEIKLVNTMKFSDIEKWEGNNSESSSDNAAVRAPPKDFNSVSKESSSSIVETPSLPASSTSTKINKNPIDNVTMPSSITSTVIDASVFEHTQETALPNDINVPEPEALSIKENSKSSTKDQEEALEETEPITDREAIDLQPAGEVQEENDGKEENEEKGEFEEEKTENEGGTKLQDYVSPLGYFRDERQINPNGIVCPYQLMGQCDDKDCKYMHLDE